jgi:hypothetical protein
MRDTPADFLSLIKQSPVHAAAHDRQAWLDLFAEDATLEDPVGSAAARKRDGSLGAFWDTFIAPHDVRFEVKQDFLQGDDVLRDVVIHTQMGSGVSVKVPAYLLYSAHGQGAARRVERMAAHWTLKQGKFQIEGASFAAVRPMTAMFARMLRRLGPGWAWAYMASAWRGVGAHGVRSAKALAKAVSGHDDAALAALFDAGAELRFGEQRGAPAALLTFVPPGSELTIEQPIAAGWVTACRFRVDGPTPTRGLALLETAPASRKLQRVRFFTTPGPRAQVE